MMDCALPEIHLVVTISTMQKAFVSIADSVRHVPPEESAEAERCYHTGLLIASQPSAKASGGTCPTESAILFSDEI